MGVLGDKESGAPIASPTALFVTSIVGNVIEEQCVVYKWEKFPFNGCYEADVIIFPSIRDYVFLNVKLCLSGRAFEFEGKKQVSLLNRVFIKKVECSNFLLALPTRPHNKFPPSPPTTSLRMSVCWLPG